MRILIVDDSVAFRSQVKKALEATTSFEVSTASRGSIALQFLEQKEFEIVILDLNMPDMNGLQMLQEFNKRNWQGRFHSIVFASQTSKSASEALEALSLGASDFVLKPAGTSVDFSMAYLQIADQLLPRIKQFVDVPKPVRENLSPQKEEVTRDLLNFKPKGIVIASSTGGPSLLESLFAKIIGSVHVPIFIVQHMPPLFTNLLAQRLSSISGLPCQEASHCEVIEENKVYIAPGDYHLSLLRDGSKVIAQLDQSEKINSVRPAADKLFSSAAKVYGADCRGMVLTGMGQDGLDGSMAIKKAGGTIIIQDKETSTVWGMPGAVFKEGAYDLIADANKCGDILKKMAG